MVKEGLRTPFFSVVIPTFNCADKLNQSLSSVLSQTFANFEVLVMDDGSTDRTAEIVASIDDKRVRYYWNPNSGGPATPRNMGMDLCEGAWICFLDADDIWYPNKLERVFSKIDDNVDVICHWEMLRETGNTRLKLLKHGPYEVDLYKELLAEGNCLSPSATCVRKDFIRAHGLRFNESPDYVIVEDYDFWMQLARYHARCVFIEEALGEYVLGEGNISANEDRYFSNLETMLRQHVFHIQSFSDPHALWKIKRAELNLLKAKSHLAGWNIVSGLQLLVWTALLNPITFIKKLFSLKRL